jgi:hypothetical protein
MKNFTPIDLFIFRLKLLTPIFENSIIESARAIFIKLTFTLSNFCFRARDHLLSDLVSQASEVVLKSFSLELTLEPKVRTSLDSDDRLNMHTKFTEL